MVDRNEVPEYVGYVMSTMEVYILEVCRKISTFLPKEVKEVT